MSISGETADNTLIKVDTGQKMLYLIIGEQIIKQYPIRIGKKESPTPIGEGYIYVKREMPIFRYKDPPDKGKIIRYSKQNNGEFIRVPYEKMRALGIRIKGYPTDKFSIHSTTAEDSIGKAVSNGCIGMKINDLLELFPLVKEGDKIIII